MKLKKYMQSIRFALLLLFGATMVASCISEGEETYVLEEPDQSASQMLIGGWGGTSVEIWDEDGHEVPEGEIGGGILDNIPDIEFGDDGEYTITYPDGDTETGSWYTSDDGSEVYFSHDGWEIFSLGKDRLVLVYYFYHDGRYYYIVYIFEKTYTPGQEEPVPGGDDDDIPGLGDVSDNNPYQPYTKNLISKITLVRNYGAGGETQEIHSFQYDSKARIMEYVVESTTIKGLEETVKFNFTYDDDRVNLYMDGELLNSGLIGDNGYLSELYEGKSTDVNSWFVYDSHGFLTELSVEGSGSDWAPSYDYSGNMLSPQPGGDQLEYYGDIFNKYSVDLNGLFTTCYQWEWFMHLDYSGIVLGLFDFYGLRGPRVAFTCQRGNYWTDEIVDFEGGFDYDPSDMSNPLTRVVIERTGLNNEFIATYEIEYY